MKILVSYNSKKVVKQEDNNLKIVYGISHATITETDLIEALSMLYAQRYGIDKHQSIDITIKGVI